MRGAFSRIAGIVAVSMIPGLTAGAAPADAVEGLQAWLDGTRDLRCRFEQRLLSGALGSGTAESGVLIVLRPGHLRWDYTKPEAKTAVVDGDRTLLYLAEDRQLVRGKLSKDEDLLPALLAGRERIVDLFHAKETWEKRPNGEMALGVRLVPKSAPEGLEEIFLALRSSDFAIERAEVLDGAGNRIEYRFSALRRNAGIDLSAFAFEPPPGTEIVGER